MNHSIIRTLILKDWYLQRWPLTGLLFGAAVSLAVLAIATEGAAFAGIVLIITVMIIAGVNVATSTIAGERKEQTLAFVMSLPVSSREYTLSKMLGGSLLLLLGWTVLMLGVTGVILTSAGLPDGLIPYTVIVLTELLASSFVLLAVALVTESQAWTIGVMVFGNLFVNGFLYYVTRMPSINQGLSSPMPIWNETVVKLLVSEIGVIALALSLAFYLQGRKTDFL